MGFGFAALLAVTSPMAQEITGLTAITTTGMTGVVGPILLSFIYDRINNYNLTIIMFGSLFIIVLIVSIWIRSDIKRLEAKNGQQFRQELAKVFQLNYYFTNLVAIDHLFLCWIIEK